jgi:hypothetical protein
MEGAISFEVEIFDDLNDKRRDSSDRERRFLKVDATNMGSYKGSDR